jgi:hypothetical protein
MQNFSKKYFAMGQDVLLQNILQCNRKKFVVALPGPLSMTLSLLRNCRDLPRKIWSGASGSNKKLTFPHKE